MITRHLGKRLYDLADGRLENAENLEAMAHLETCSACSRVWHEALSARLALQTSGSGIDMRFSQRLLDRARIAEIAGAEPRRQAKAARGIRPHVLRATALASVALVFALAALYVLGEPHQVSLRSFAADSGHGARSLALVNHPIAAEGGVASWDDPAWEGTDIVPLSSVVVERDGAPVLRATAVFGPQQMVISELRGQLVVDPADGLVRTEAESHTVYVLEGVEVTVLFESGDSVIRIDCYCELHIVLDATAEFPEAQPPGVLERIGSGVATVASAVTGG